MLAHLVDHMFFSSRLLKERTKNIVFAVCVAAVVACFLWFRGLAFGMEGPIKDTWGLGWRKVRRFHFPLLNTYSFGLCAELEYL